MVSNQLPSVSVRGRSSASAMSSRKDSGTFSSRVRNWKSSWSGHSTFTQQLGAHRGFSTKPFSLSFLKLRTEVGDAESLRPRLGIHTVVTRSWIGIVHICCSQFYFCGVKIENRRHLRCLRFCFLGFVSILRCCCRSHCLSPKRRFRKSARLWALTSSVEMLPSFSTTT